MRRLVVVLTLGALCTGCGTVDWFRDKRETRSEAAQLVGRADELVREGQPGAARISARSGSSLKHHETPSMRGHSTVSRGCTWIPPGQAA
jgi:hypothetical protein